MTETVNVIPKGARLAVSDKPGTGLEQTVAIEDIIIGDRYRKDDGDLAELIESINDVGLIQPIGVTPDRHLIFGARRLAACRELGWTEIQARVTEQFNDAVALLHAELDENTCRKDMTMTEKLAVGAALEALERPRAKARQTDGRRLGGEVFAGREASVPRGTEASGQKYEHNRTAATVASALGMETHTYQRARAIADAAANENLSEQVRTLAQGALEAIDRGDPVRPAYELVNKAKRTPKSLTAGSAMTQFLVQLGELGKATEAEILRAADLYGRGAKLGKLAREDGYTEVVAGQVGRGGASAEYVLTDKARQELAILDHVIDAPTPRKVRSGPRRKSLLKFQAIQSDLDGLNLALREIQSEGLDSTMQTDEAALLLDGLIKSIKVLASIITNLRTELTK